LPASENLHRRRLPPASFDHLVGAAKKRNWERDAERSGGLEIQDEIDFRGPLHGKIGRPLAFEDATGIDAKLTILLNSVRSVAHKAAGIDKLAVLIDCGQRVTCGQKRYCA
jgi:hypothetical protein